MPKTKPTMSPEDRAEMNEGIARALRNIGGEPQELGQKPQLTHVMNLGTNSSRKPQLTVTKKGPGTFLLTGVCDSCNEPMPVALRVMPDKSIRDQPRCSKCRKKQEAARKKHEKLNGADIPF